jgi:hypothetical protein
MNPPEHICDWDCLTMHTFVPYPQFFCDLKSIAYVCTPKMAEDELNALFCLFPRHVCSHVINLLSLPSPCLFIWCLGASGRTWHMESQEFGPWFKTPVSSFFHFHTRVYNISTTFSLFHPFLISSPLPLLLTLCFLVCFWCWRFNPRPSYANQMLYHWAGSYSKK